MSDCSFFVKGGCWLEQFFSLLFPSSSFFLTETFDFIMKHCHPYEGLFKAGKQMVVPFLYLYYQVCILFSSKIGVWANKDQVMLCESIIYYPLNESIMVLPVLREIRFYFSSTQKYEPNILPFLFF